MNEIEEVKSRLDIVEIIGQSVPLKKVGRTFKAPCPFHQEKTPSFIVTPDRQTWHCFGSCATGGDVISFVMKREGMDFPEALRLLADRAGVKLPERKVSIEQDKERERLFAANEAAAEYFAALLKAPSGSAASAYVESRGIDDLTAQAFGMGYSLDNWDDCREQLREKGFNDRELLAAGLVIQGDNGLYDRFRGRLTFAIWDAKGRVIGFGARALDDSLPKYLNTAQTAVFDKGGTLYALDKAFEAIRSAGQAVVVEGYMDVIAAHQFGHKNVVAQMGTALTDRQYGLLKRVADKIVLVLDADGAGQDAMHKVALDVSGSERVSADPMAFKERLPVELQTSGHFYVAALPAGKDPDELIRRDPKVWKSTIDSARPYIDFWIEYVATRADLVSPQGKKAAAGEMLQIVRSIDDTVIRAHYIQKVSRLARVPEPELATMARRGGKALQSSGGAGSTTDGPLSSEEFLLATLLQYNHVPVPADASADLLIDARGKSILELRKQHEDREELKRATGPDLAAYIERLIMYRLPISGEDQAPGVVDDCVRKLKQRRLQAEQQAIAAQIAALQDESRPSPAASEVDAPASLEMETLIQRNMEIGRELHTRGRKDGPIPSGVE
jgi:DNA primase